MNSDLSDPHLSTDPAVSLIPLSGFFYSSDLPSLVYLGNDMQKLNSFFDNRETMQREAWIEGELAGQWPAAMCGSELETVTPWERKVLEKLWAAYPNPPTDK